MVFRLYDVLCGFCFKLKHSNGCKIKPYLSRATLVENVAKNPTLLI